MQTQDRFADLERIRVCYRLDGPQDAPAVFLIAGLGMQLIEWPDTLVDGLAEHFRVIRLDNRDSGLSDRIGGPYQEVPKGFAWSGSAEGLAFYGLKDMGGDVLALADHLGIETFDCVGFSMGGMIAQHLAIYAPTRLRRLVSLSSTAGTADLTADPRSLWHMERFFLPFASPAGKETAILESNDHFSVGLMPASDPQSREFAETLAARGQDQGGYLRQALAITTSPSWREQLTHITMPALIIHGDADPCIDETDARSLAARLARATFLGRQGLGHWIDEATGHCIVDWLRDPPG